MIKSDYNITKTFFATTVPVLVTHLNYGNHLGYDSLLSIIQDARMYWLKKYGMSESSIDGSVGFIIKELIVDYKAEAFHGDLLLIELYASDLSRSSFVFEYKVSNSITNQIVAFAKTLHVFFDYTHRKVSKTPECFTNAVLESENKTSIL